MFGKYFIVCIGHLLSIVLVLKFFGLFIPHLTICYHSGFFGSCVILTVAFFTFGLTKSRFLKEKIKPGKKAVLITGCDSGFGHFLAKRLDAEGFHVFASCLFPSGAGATALKESCSDRLKVLELDVTKDGSVQSAAEFVESNLGSQELWAIVNNAGILTGFAVEITEMKAFETSLEVNALGPVRVTKAFLPLLKKSKGRIVNVTSYLGRMILPFDAPYGMSKYALTAFSDILRQEVDSYGIKVISIEPEIFRTDLSNTEKIIQNLNKEFDTLQLGNKQSERRHGLLTPKLMRVTLSLASSKTELVIRDMEAAVTSEYPSSTYRPRANAFTRFIYWFLEMLPIDLRDFEQKIVLYFIDIFL